MSTKGTIRTMVDGRLIEYLPKTIAEQVFLSNGNTLADRLAQLDSGSIITDPDNIIDNSISVIEGSDKMPTTDRYFILPFSFNTSAYQMAFCPATKKKFERWKLNGVWTNWIPFSGEGIKVSQSQNHLTILEHDVTSFELPIDVYNPETQELVIIRNNTILGDNKYTIVNKTLTLIGGVKAFARGTEITVLITEIVKTDLDPLYNYDGSNIVNKSISITKLKDDIYATPKTNGSYDELNSVNLMTPKATHKMIQDTGIINRMVKVCNVAHNIGRYPIVQMLIHDDGAGVCGAGEHGAGGTDPTTEKFSVSHLSKNELSLSCDIKYQNLGDVVVTSGEANMVHISFTNSDKCITLLMI